MPLPGGLPPLPNIPNLNLPLPDLSAVSLAGGTLPGGGTTGRTLLQPDDAVIKKRETNLLRGSS